MFLKCARINILITVLTKPFSSCFVHYQQIECHNHMVTRPCTGIADALAPALALWQDGGFDNKNSTEEYVYYTALDIAS